MDPATIAVLASLIGGPAVIDLLKSGLYAASPDLDPQLRLLKEQAKIEGRESSKKRQASTRLRKEEEAKARKELEKAVKVNAIQGQMALQDRSTAGELNTVNTLMSGPAPHMPGTLTNILGFQI